ncbi:6014_t:CDS:2 [Diversispora eburnea]|uniref:6014_t:CDS:1 n=1 Tax=Diversispora eburnea TaxID=1213867 RepID=A0A9N8VIV3_9GLOM|nr:6014_t:CDS:2 [Diversispora eburnea]
MNIVITKLGISVTNSDGVGSFQPTNDSESSSCYYRLIDSEEPKACAWLNKLGSFLTNWLKDNGNYKTNKVKEKLLAFPTGYYLYEYRKLNIDGTVRSDTYLYGAHRFRSPSEFSPHLKWLVTKEPSSFLNLPVQNQASRTKMAKYAEYRTGEIVWVNLLKANEPRKVAPDVDKVKFTIKLVVINIEVNLRRTGMLPWKAYDPKISDSLFERVIEANQTEPRIIIIETNIQEYVRAVHRAKEAALTYSPMKSFSVSEKSVTYQHFEALMYGAEVIRAGDLVRLIPEDTEDKEVEPEYPEFLEIGTIFKNPEKGIQLTGNILQRGKLLNKTGPLKLEDYKWWISHDLNEEFTIDLEDVAGRFYLMMPHLTIRTKANIFKNVNDRMSIIESGSDMEKLKSIPVTPIVSVIPAKRTLAKLSTRIDNSDSSPSVKKQKRYIVQFPKKRPVKIIKKEKFKTKPDVE